MQKLFQQFSNIPKYLVAAVLIIVVLYPKFPFLRIPGTSVSIRLEDFLLLTLGVVALVKIISNFKEFFSDKIVTAFLLFFGVGLVSLISGAVVSHTLTLSLGSLHLLRRVEYVVPLFAFFALFQKGARSNLDFYVKLLMIVTAVVFLYGFGQRYFNLPIIDTQNDEYAKGVALRWTPGAHINSTFAGHYDLASYLVLVLPIFTTLFFLADDGRLKLWLLGVIGPGLWLLGASLSRVSLVSWVIASCLSLILVKKYKATLVVLVAAVLVVAAFPSFLGRYQQLLKIIGFRASNFEVMADSQVIPQRVSLQPTASALPLAVLEDRSTSIRLKVEWPRAIMAFYKSPLLGTGYSSIGLATDNDYLRILGEIGILGLTAFVLIFYRVYDVFLYFIKHKDKFDTLETSFVVGITGAGAGTFLTAIFIDIFEASKFAITYWLLMGYAIILIRNKLYEQ